MSNPAVQVEQASPLAAAKKDALLEQVAISGVWAAIVSVPALVFLGTPAAETILYVYLIWLAYKKESSTWGEVLSLSLFLCLGWFAGHRFEAAKIMDWGLWTMLPFLAAVVAIKLPVPAIGSRLLGFIRLHWLPFAVLAANAAIWASAVWLSYAWGILLVLLLTRFAYSDRRRAFQSGLVAVTLYTGVVHLFQWRGIVALGTDPLLFLTDNWHTLVIPYLALAAMTGGRKR